MEGPVLRSFSYIKKSWDFSTGWLVHSAGQKIPVQLGWYLPLHKIPLAENTFLQAGQRELKIQKKNPGNALRMSQRLSGLIIGYL
jgi:hypothetical protein